MYKSILTKQMMIVFCEKEKETKMRLVLANKKLRKSLFYTER